MNKPGKTHSVAPDDHDTHGTRPRRVTPARMQFHNNERLVRAVSINQVRQPIYQLSVQPWRRYEDALKPLLERLGESVNG